MKTLFMVLVFNFYYLSGSAFALDINNENFIFFLTLDCDSVKSTFEKNCNVGNERFLVESLFIRKAKKEGWRSARSKCSAMSASLHQRCKTEVSYSILNYFFKDEQELHFKIKKYKREKKKEAERIKFQMESIKRTGDFREECTKENSGMKIQYCMDAKEVEYQREK